MMTVGELINELKDYDSDMNVGIYPMCIAGDRSNSCACRHAKNIHTKKVLMNNCMTRESFPNEQGIYCVILSTNEDVIEWCDPNDA